MLQKTERALSTRERLAEYYPAFGLSVKTPRLSMRMPDDDDILDLAELAARGIHPPGQTPFATTWSMIEPRFQQRNTLSHFWDGRGSTQTDNWNLVLAIDVDGVLVGAQGLHARSWRATRTAESGSWLGREYQGQGLGKEMRFAILQLLFDGLDADVATTNAYTDNPASLGVTRALGYRENGVDRVPNPMGEGHKDLVRFVMTREEFAPIRRDDIEIMGAQAVAEVFGTERAVQKGD